MSMHTYMVFPRELSNGSLTLSKTCNLKIALSTIIYLLQLTTETNAICIARLQPNSDLKPPRTYTTLVSPSPQTVNARSSSPALAH